MQNTAIKYLDIVTHIAKNSISIHNSMHKGMTSMATMHDS